MIEINDIVKIYTVGGQKIQAVDSVSLSCSKGEYISIVGHSGSGKSTLLSLIGGLTKPDSGSVAIDGVNLWSLSDAALSEFRNKKMSFIFQFASLIPTLTAVENIMLPSVFSKIKEDKRGAALGLLEMMGLADKADSYPSQLSGGQQRRVAIARAFINNPEIILADEPTGDLDEETEAEIIGFFRRMNKEKGITFIVVTHNTAVASSSDKMFRMSAGKLLDASKVITSS
jgi:putative ABC transport system ATP-binding protein/lipoprotein-releasing system ATP-binding protein